MEKIVNILDRMEGLTQRSTCSTKLEIGKSELDRAEKIITYLKSIYPLKTINLYGSKEQVETASKLWATHLHGIEDEFVKKALKECVDKFSWCPDVAEFKQLCISYRPSTKLPWAEEVLKFEKPKNAKITDAHVRTVIDEGAEICKKLKSIYPDKSWMTIAGLFTQLKKKARIYHPGLDDIKIIRELMKYSHQDVIDALGV